MKNLISVITIAVIVSALIAACSGQVKTDNSMQEQQPRENSVTVTDSEIVKCSIIEDTVIGHWTVKTKKCSNDVVVGRDDWAVRDSSVFLTLYYDNKVVYSDKEIRTKYVVGGKGA